LLDSCLRPWFTPNSGIAFLLVSALLRGVLPQPFFDYVASNNDLQSVPALKIIVFVVIYQIIPITAIFAVDRAVVRVGKAFLQRFF
jgi:hypothetical protein